MTHIFFLEMTLKRLSPRKYADSFISYWWDFRGMRFDVLEHLGLEHLGEVSIPQTNTRWQNKSMTWELIMDQG